MFIKILITGLLGLSLELSGCCFKLFRKRPALTQHPLSGKGVGLPRIDDRSINKDNSRFQKILDEAGINKEGYIEKDNPYFKEILECVKAEKRELRIAVFKRGGQPYGQSNFDLALINYFRNKSLIDNEQIYIMQDKGLLLRVWLTVSSDRS